ncbi:hypothetical protein ACQJBY_013638 [Aegilops geniculata]
MENRSPTSVHSVDPVDPIPIPLDTPIHFRIPMGRDPDVLLSVDGSGKTLRSWPDGPCERRATMPDVATSFGEGPLVLVEVDVDGSYFTRTHLPCCVFRSCPSLQGIINRVCSTLRRPLPFCYQPPYPCGDDFVASLVNPPRLGVIANCLSSPCMFTLHLHNWGIAFYIRLDLAGLYHTYPHVAGGPFQTLEEAYSAIHGDLQDRRDPRMFMRQPNDSQVDYVVRQCLHWPDGTRKKRLKSQPIEEIRDHKRQLVQALVDKYNDYLGDTAYVLKDVVQYTSVRLLDCQKITNHINFTARAKGTEDSDCSMDDLFFAEVTSMIGDDKLVVSCFCRVKTTDNGRCHGCTAKHPIVAVYLCGEAGASPFGGPVIDRQVVEEDLEAEERRVRRYYENLGLDKPGYFDELRAIMPGGSVMKEN